MIKVEGQHFGGQSQLKSKSNYSCTCCRMNNKEILLCCLCTTKYLTIYADNQ